MTKNNYTNGIPSLGKLHEKSYKKEQIISRLPYEKVFDIPDFNNGPFGIFGKRWIDFFNHKNLTPEEFWKRNILD
jgi:hypothetical protein